MSPYAGARVAVLGASGFIGRWVARVLTMQGARLSLIVRDQAASGEIFGRYGIQGRVVELDLRETQSVQDALAEIRPSIIFNLAGYGVDRAERDRRTAYTINARLVRAICAAAQACPDAEWPGRQVVHVGSALEYGAIGGNLAEDSLCCPTTLYGKSKLAGTRLASRYGRTHGIRSLTARLFTVYGPGEGAGRLLPSLIEAGRTGQPLALTAGRQQRDFTYVEDVADGLLRLGVTTGQAGEVVNLATGQLTSVRRFAETAAGILNLPGDRLRFGASPVRPEEMEHDPVTVERLRTMTGWVPSTNIEVGIHRTLEFNRRLQTATPHDSQDPRRSSLPAVSR